VDKQTQNAVNLNPGNQQTRDELVPPQGTSVPPQETSAPSNPTSLWDQSGQAMGKFKNASPASSKPSMAPSATGGAATSPSAPPAAKTAPPTQTPASQTGNEKWWTSDVPQSAPQQPETKQAPEGWSSVMKTAYAALSPVEQREAMADIEAKVSKREAASKAENEKKVSSKQPLLAKGESLFDPDFVPTTRVDANKSAAVKWGDGDFSSSPMKQELDAKVDKMQQESERDYDTAKRLVETADPFILMAQSPRVQEFAAHYMKGKKTYAETAKTLDDYRRLSQSRVPS
jgi:hypothetical protein